MMNDTLTSFAAIMLSCAVAWSPHAAPRTDPLSCKLVLTIDGSVSDRWEHTTSGQKINVPEASTVVKQQMLWACVFFSHCAHDAKGNANVTYDVRVTKPDGGVYYEGKGLDGWNLASGDETGVLLAKTLFAVSFDPPDPLGEYTVLITVHDSISGASATDTHKIGLVDYKPGAKVASTDELGDWLGRYSTAPEPERAIPALLALAKQPTAARGSKFSTATGFFLEVLDSNAWLCPLVLAEYKDQDAVTRGEMLRLLARSGCDLHELEGKLDAHDREIWSELAHREKHDPMHDPISGREDINELLGRFAASAKLGPVARLCDALAPDETGAVAKTSVHDSHSGIDVPLGRVVRGVGSKINDKSEHRVL
jgi:hypothetical protein